MNRPEIFSIPGFTEPVSSLSHLVGAGLFMLLAIPMLRRGWGNWTRVVCLSIHSLAIVFQLAMSGVYHLLSLEGMPRVVLLRLDTAAIFAVIAGTFTPIYAILFRGAERWGMLLFMWSVAIAGMTLRSIYFYDFPEVVALVLYLAMGWVGVFTAVRLYRRFGAAFIGPLIWGGIAYTVAAVLEFHRWPTLIPGVFGPHEMFHLGVMVGIAFHWRFIYQFASGNAARKPKPAEQDSAERQRAQWR